MFIEDFYERKHLNSDLICCNFTELSDEEYYECLRWANSELMKNYSIRECWALGTNTLRVAENASDFLIASQAQGIQIKVISGIQEAMLIYAGVCLNLPKNGRLRLAADIGGGSTEVVLGRDDQRIIAESIEVGSVSWRDKFFLDLRSEIEGFKAEKKGQKLF